MSVKSKKLFVDTDASMHLRTYTQTFETGFIRSTLTKSRPKNRYCLEVTVWVIIREGLLAG